MVAVAQPHPTIYALARRRSRLGCYYGYQDSTFPHHRTPERGGSRTIQINARAEVLMTAGGAPSGVRQFRISAVSLSTNPIAPASRACAASIGLSFIVTRTTSVRRASSRRCRIASTLDALGMRRSSTSTSGRCVCSSRTAVAMSFRFGDHLEVWFTFQQQPQAAAHDRVVDGQDHPDGHLGGRLAGERVATGRRCPRMART